jgi:IS1 family transposase
MIGPSKENPASADNTAGRTVTQANLNASPSNCILTRFAAVERGGTVANFMKRDKQIQVLKLLVEGNSIRSTERIASVSRNAIMRLLVRFGTACREFLDETLVNLSLQHVQLDEIWTFCRMKEGLAKKRRIDSSVIGDQYLYTALDTETKLLVTFAIGKRRWETTNAFIADLKKRLVIPTAIGDERPQLSTDGFESYLPAIRRHFQGAVKHGVLIKRYTDKDTGRYSPPPLVGTERININGISNLATICTSHVERHNLTLRTFLKRFTRLSMGFSKKLTNLAAAAALQVAYYNFCWRLRRPGSSGQLTPTPAMMAGLVDTLWTIDDLYDAVMKQQAKKKRSAWIEKMLRQLRSID